MEYKGSIPPDERPEFLSSLQSAFEDIVTENIPTKIETLPKEDAEALCNRLANNFDFSTFGEVKEVRVVTVAHWACPCGGTHVKRTGDLATSEWKIKGVKSKKGAVRVKYSPKQR